MGCTSSRDKDAVVNPNENATKTAAPVTEAAPVKSKKWSLHKRARSPKSITTATDLDKMVALPSSCTDDSAQPTAEVEPMAAAAGTTTDPSAADNSKADMPSSPAIDDGPPVSSSTQDAVSQHPEVARAVVQSTRTGSAADALQLHVSPDHVVLDESGSHMACNPNLAPFVAQPLVPLPRGTPENPLGAIDVLHTKLRVINGSSLRLTISLNPSAHPVYHTTGTKPPLETPNMEPSANATVPKLATAQQPLVVTHPLAAHEVTVVPYVKWMRAEFQAEANDPLEASSSVAADAVEEQITPSVVAGVPEVWGVQLAALNQLIDASISPVNSPLSKKSAAAAPTNGPPNSPSSKKKAAAAAPTTKDPPRPAHTNGDGSTVPLGLAAMPDAGVGSSAAQLADARVRPDAGRRPSNASTTSNASRVSNAGKRSGKGGGGNRNKGTTSTKKLKKQQKR